MNYLYVLTLIIAAVYTSLVSAETYNTRDARTHGDWRSLELYLGDERVFRAINITSYSDTSITIDYSRGECDSPLIVTRIDMGEIYSTTEGVIKVFSSEFRVDRMTIHKGLAWSSTERGDSGVYINYAFADVASILKDMRTGRVARIKISGDDMKDMYMEFGLSGSMAAINRAVALCRAASQGPESYFENAGSAI